MALKAADCVTGLMLDGHREVVAVLVARRRSGYPEARDDATAPLRSTALFEPVSLPVRGRVGDFGRFAPAPGQEAERLALAMTGSADWKGLEQGALREGCVIDVGGSPWPEDVPATGQVLGVIFVDGEVWERLCAMRGRDREADVGEVLTALRKAASRPLTERLVEGGRLLDLEAVADDHVTVDGTVRRLPPLAGSLAYREGGRTFGSDFSRWLRRRSDGYGGTNGLGWEERSRRLLDGMWEVEEVTQAMRMLGRVVTPSPSLPDWPQNHEAVASFSLAGLSTVADVLSSKAEDDSDSALDALAAMADGLEALHAKVADAVARARAMRLPEP